MELEAAKMIGAGLAVIALAGVGVGIGNISKGNLRIKTKRARALLADCLGRKKK